MPLVGAIRWDAWFPGNTYPGFVDKSLYTDYSSREPIYGWYDIDVPDHAGIVDRQIQDAADGKLDFWAFVWYPDDSSHEGIARMNNALKDYMCSPKHDLIRFCLILQTGWAAGKNTGGKQAWRSKHVPEYIDFMRDAQYVRVDGNRPLVFWMDTAQLDDGDKGFGAEWAEEMQFLAEACGKAGLGAPYLVDMRHDYKSAEKFGYDGVSDYGPASIARKGRFGYADLAAHDHAKMATAHSLKVLPGISAVIDPRPRYHEGWGGGTGLKYYGYSFEIPTYTEWLNHLQDTFKWLSRHPEKCSDPPVIAIYSWNELDEGGAGIIPTKQEGTMFLDALRAVKTGEFPAHVENRVNDSNPAIVYVGDWKKEFPVNGCYCDDQTWSGSRGDYLTFSFTGTRIAVLGERGPHCGMIAIYIDGQKEQTVDLSQGQPALQQTLFAKEGLREGTHTIKLVSAGPTPGQDEGPGPGSGPDQTRGAGRSQADAQGQAQVENRA